MNHAQILGLDSIDNARDIKRAYAKLIKEFRPESHPVEFGNIRAAYEAALKEFEWNRQSQLQDSSEVKNPHELVDSKSQESLLNEYDKDFSESQTKNHSEYPVSIFLSQLVEFAKNDNETSAKLLTSQFLESVINTTIDEKMDIEIALLTWTFNSTKPLLLAFIAMDSYFKWTKNLAFSTREFVAWEAQRLQGLRLLADVYSNALKLKSSSLAYYRAYPWSFLLSNSQLEERKQWESLCEHFGYNELKSYFKPCPTSKFPILLGDFYIALIIGMLCSILTIESDGVIFFLATLTMVAIALGFNVFFGPLIVKRSVQAALFRKYNVLILIIGIILSIWIFNNKLNFNISELLDTRSGYGNSFPKINPKQGLIDEFALNKENKTSPIDAFNKKNIEDFTSLDASNTLPSHKCFGINYRKSPDYPRASRMYGEEGKVMVKLNVDTDGSLISTAIEKSSGFKRLDVAALSAVSDWCFVPFKKDKKTVQVWVTVPIVFSLQ